MKKAFNSKKDLKEFKDKYKSLEIKTEVISNFLQPFHMDESPAIKDYCDLFFPEDPSLFKAMTSLKFLVEARAHDVMQSKFGKCDFKFEGNRTYRNYVIDFEGLIIVVPAKREVVINEKSFNEKEEFLHKLVQFEKKFTQFCIDSIVENKENLDQFEIDVLLKSKETGLLDDNYQVDFNFIKGSNKKLKIKA